MIASDADWSGFASEFAGAKLGDFRRTERLMKMASAVEASPGSSFPKQMGEGAALEGAYRFLENESVSFEAVLAPHIERTVERARCDGDVLVLHDTSELKFEGDVPRAGLGRIKGGGHGFAIHTSLAVGRDGAIHGIVGMEPLFRTEVAPKKKRTNTDRANGVDCESTRWSRQALATGKLLAFVKSSVHVMDREADGFEIIHAMHGEAKFVVRVLHDRAIRVDEPAEPDEIVPRTVFEALKAAPVLGRRALVHLTARGRNPNAKGRAINPERDAREANLMIRAARCTISPPSWAKKGQFTSLTLNYVFVDEFDPPEGQPAVCWRLVTSEPIETSADVERIVDIYRKRWLIEEFFKGLKTGCSYEKRQLESDHTLLNALALLAPMAAMMLHLRWLSRCAEDHPASDALPRSIIDAIGALERRAGRTWPKEPTAREALMAIARVGGHIKHNGYPGWLVMWRGMERVRDIALGMSLVRQDASE